MRESWLDIKTLIHFIVVGRASDLFTGFKSQRLRASELLTRAPASKFRKSLHLHHPELCSTI